MPSSSEIADLSLELAWSLWAELGVSGWTRRHSWQAADVEALILFTAYLMEQDARLRDESLDWCVRNARFVSSVRLRNLSPPLAAASAGFARYAATVRVHSHASWPGAGEPIPFRRTGRSTEPELSRPALIQLRLRAVVGVSARAEVLRLLLAEPGRPQSASELAVRGAYGKGNVAATLDMLVRSGVAETQRVGNQLRYRLVQHQELVAVLGGVPPVFPDWTVTFRVLLGLLTAGEMGEPGSIARAANIRRLLRSLDGDLRQLRLTDPVPQATGAALNEDFDRWSVRLVRRWAVPDDTAVPSEDVRYTVHRLSTGDWLATVSDPESGSRPVTLPEWEGLYPGRPRSDAVIADDSYGAPQLAHALLHDAEHRAGRDIGQMWTVDSTNQEIARTFADERLWPMRRGQSATFSADFLRRWRADRLRR